MIYFFHIQLLWKISYSILNIPLFFLLKSIFIRITHSLNFKFGSAILYNVLNKQSFLHLWNRYQMELFQQEFQKLQNYLIVFNFLLWTYYLSFPLICCFSITGKNNGKRIILIFQIVFFLKKRTYLLKNLIFGNHFEAATSSIFFFLRLAMFAFYL